MKLHHAGITPLVRRLSHGHPRPVALELGSMSFRMSAAESLDLANRLVDAAESKGTK